MLCLHGKQDNCGTFDRLVPLLRRGFYYVCLDLPGHGRSSHFPPGFRVTLESYAVAALRAADRLGWTRFACLGHSMGGMTGSLLAALYPERVTALAMVDSAGPAPVHPHDTVPFMRRVCDGLLAVEAKAAAGSAPAYTYDQALGLILTKRPSRLTRPAAEVLIARSLRELPDRGHGRYAFTTDQRLKVDYNPVFTPVQQLAVVQAVRCPVLYLRAVDNDEHKKPGPKLTRKMYKSNPNVRVVKVDGNHDVHLNHPERIAPLIDTFLVSAERSKI